MNKAVKASVEIQKRQLELLPADKNADVKQNPKDRMIVVPQQ